ncbi:MAG: MMPL family transporter [Methylococcales bacterium]|nr:MMPL family transporter [Methylococcales bacterium]
MKQGNKLSSFINGVTRHPWWVLIITLMLVIIMALGMESLSFKTDYRVYFSDENPQLLAFENIQAIYNKSDAVLFIVEPKEKDVFTTVSLAAIQELTKKAWQTPYSSRVDSITNFQHTKAEADNLIVADLVQNPHISADKIAIIKQIALAEPLLVNRLVSTSGHVAGINVTVQLPNKDPNEAAEIAASARALVKDIEARYPNIKVHLTGMAMMSNAFSESAMNDNKTLVPAMYLIVIFVLLISLRSVSATFSVVLLIIFSIVSTLGITGWVGWFLTPTSAISPTVILTMAVADCVHILVTQLHYMRIGYDKIKAIEISLTENFRPIFLTSITTAIGFLSMNFSDAPPFRDLGNMVAIGVMLAWVLSITFLPAMMVVLPITVKIRAKSDASSLLWLADWVIVHRKKLLIGNLLIALTLISFAPNNELNDEFVKYFDKTVEFRKGTDFMNHNMGGIYTVEFSIPAQEAGGISEPRYLQTLEKLKQWLMSQPEVVHVKSITDTLKRLNRSMHGDDPQWYKLPESRELSAQYLLLYEISLPYGLDLNDEINIDKSGTRLTATLQSLSSNEMLAIEARINTWLGRHMPSYAVSMASPTLMFAHIGKRNITQMIFGSLLALVLISLLLLFAFKSVRLGLISLLPNLIPAGVAFGIWGIIDGRIGLGLSVVTGLTLGIVVDDTVHFISKYNRARTKMGLNTHESVRYAFSTVGVALWITSAVLVCGFMVLSLSHFTMNGEMGLMTAITIVVALLFDLLLLPPLLMSLDSSEKK